MSVPTRRVLGLTLAASLSACATGQLAPLQGDPDALTSAELSHSKAPTMYEAIEQLRPRFLRTRGPSSLLNSSAMGPAVIVDQSVLGGIETLVDIPLGDVAAVRYVGAWDAATRHGPGYANGVIEVTTWRGRRAVAPN